jgi:hypothetical protein
MNTRETVKTKAAAVEKRYGKTIKGDLKRKPKPKLKLRPVLGKDKIGIKGKVTF